MAMLENLFAKNLKILYLENFPIYGNLQKIVSIIYIYVGSVKMSIIGKNLENTIMGHNRHKPTEDLLN